MSINTIPNELLLYIFTLIPNIENNSNISTVSKRFYRTKNEVFFYHISKIFKDIYQYILNDKKLALLEKINHIFTNLINEVSLISGGKAFLQSLHYESSVKSVTNAKKMQNWIQNQKDKNLIIFCKEIPEINNSLPDQIKNENDSTQKAILLKQWLEENTEILASILEIHSHNNNLTLLPKEIGLFINLRKLSLKHNQIKTLPKELGNLSDLISLNLDNNKITETPKEFENLTNLKHLNLTNNQLTILPEELIKLKHLQSLDIVNNPLKRIPWEIMKLSSHSRLYSSFFTDKYIFYLLFLNFILSYCIVTSLEKFKYLS